MVCWPMAPTTLEKPGAISRAPSAANPVLLAMLSNFLSAASKPMLNPRDPNDVAAYKQELEKVYDTYAKLTC
jgi:hypothetical protein